ncbi:hypothetical protein [Streptomyces sp. NPDC059008]|uniref:hypothetical protein n=1 Tax=Streptomyces sp. NPDC059008 TaxID=3346693 RepID=UPI0036871C19
MRRPGRGAGRTGRGLLCASACLLLGAASHVAAGGRLPGAGALGVLFAVLTVQGAVLFGGRRRRFDVTTLTLGGTQFALHLAFHHLSMRDGGHAMSVGHAAHRMSGSMDESMAGPYMGGMTPADLAGAGGGHSLSPAMTLAHAVATLGTALCVVYGERVLRGLAALVVPDVCFRAPAALPFTPRLRPALPSSAHPRFGVLLARSRPRRGPPSAAPA